MKILEATLCNDTQTHMLLTVERWTIWRWSGKRMNETRSNINLALNDDLIFSGAIAGSTSDWGFLLSTSRRFNSNGSDVTSRKKVVENLFYVDQWVRMDSSLFSNIILPTPNSWPNSSNSPLIILHNLKSDPVLVSDIKSLRQAST